MTDTVSNIPYAELKNWPKTMVDSANWKVRKAAAERGYGLDTLVKDKDPDVRAAVASSEFGLDVLVKDEDEFVRCAVAKQGYGLDVLAKDPFWAVRETVAEQGYALNVLIIDSDEWVRTAASKYLENQSFTLEEWGRRYPDRIVSEEGETRSVYTMASMGVDAVSDNCAMEGKTEIAPQESSFSGLPFLR